MHYKTIVLEMIAARPVLHEQLTSSNSLLLEADQYAKMLRDFHLDAVEELRDERPDSAEAQLKSEALELALVHLEELLSEKEHELTEQELSTGSVFNLDEAMAYIKQHRPNKS